MRKFTVEKRGNEFVAVDVRGKVISGPYSEEWMAHLYGTHAACAPSLQKRLKLRKVDGVYSGRPFSGVKVESCYKQPSGEWRAICTVDGERITYVANTLKAVLQFVAKHGADIKKTRNILNPDAGEIDIARSEWGGCTDPGTETTDPGTPVPGTEGGGATETPPTIPDITVPPPADLPVTPSADPPPAESQ